MHIKRDDLINRFKASGCAGMSKQEIGNIFDSMCLVIAKALQAGEEVQVPSIGTLYMKDVAERPGRNPQTGETISIAAHKVLKIRAAKGMKA